MKLVVGLTGGIGAGKSTVAKLFSERGVPIVDADLIAREVTEKDQEAYANIVNYFGTDILLSDKTLDRSKLRKIIFDDAKKRHWLEQLLHPRIQKKMEQKIKNLSAPYCIAVIPLLFEVEPYAFIDRILVVDTPEHLQIDRTLTRDRVEKAHIEAILNTQVSRYERLKKAHDVISNDGVLADLIPQVDALHRMYLELARS